MKSDGSSADSLRRRLAALTPEQRGQLERRLTGMTAARRLVTPAYPAAAHLPFPLTPVQQAYWAGRGDSFALGKVATHSYVEIEALGLDVALLTTAWNRLIGRHEMLRAMVDADGMQRVLETVPAYAIAVEDLRGLLPHVQQARLLSRRRAMSHQVLPADRWPLFEIRASQLDAHHWRLHLSFDALIADLSSRRILMREWGQLYREETVVLRPPDSTFREFVLAEIAGRKSSRYVAARDYWLARDLPPSPALPTEDDYDRYAPPHFTRRTRRLDATARISLERIARDLGITLNTLLLATYGEVLRLWSDGESFTLNLTQFNRPVSAAGVVGDFTSLILLEIERPDDRSLAARARRLQEHLWRDLDHGVFGGVELLREIARRRGGQGHYAMPVVFTSAVSNNDNTVDLDWMGEEVFSVSQTPQVWIDLMVVSSGGGLALHWNSVDALFPPRLMDDMFAALGGLLDLLSDGVLDGASSWRQIASALSPSEGRETYHTINNTQGPLPLRLLHMLWKDHVRATPDVPAVIGATRSLSYACLANLSANLGRKLRALGAAPNTLVAVVMHKGWEQVAAVLAVLEAGGGYLPIDPDVPPARLHYLLKDAGVQTVLTQPSLLDMLAWPEGTRVIAITEDAAMEAFAEPLEPVQTLSDIAYVIYTSGSTGAPKGVAIEHRGAVNTIEDINARFDVRSSDRVLALSALTFDLSVYDIFGVLAAGGTIVLPDSSRLRDPAHWSELIRRYGVTLWNAVPALMELLVDYARGQSDSDFPSLRVALLSGDRIPVALPAGMRSVGIGADVISLGGATEASIWSIYHEITSADATRRSIPYGKAMRNQVVRVLAPGLVSCPTWVPGEIHIGGIGLARGYWNDPEKTAKAFIVDSNTRERLYRTGDRGRYLPDGTIEFLGRADNQVKLRGFRVELGEIEAALAEHAEVRAAAAAAHGEASCERSLTAYVVLAPGAQCSAEDIKQHLRKRLPDYMVPTSVVVLSQLPLTPNGKLDRRALPRPKTLECLSTAVAPSAPEVERVAQIVQRISRIAVPSADSNFLDLGLTSMDLIRIVNALDGELGFRPAIDALYASPNIRWLAKECAARRQAVSAVPERAADPSHTHPTDSGFHLLARAPQPDIESLLGGRRSVRHFALRPIETERLGHFLQAIRRGSDGRNSYASASALYPVRCYVYARPGRISGLAAGPHLYDPWRHALCPATPNGLRPSAFARWNVPVFEEAAFALLLVAEMELVRARYGENAPHLATLEAGLMTQVLELAAPVCGLGLCQIGSADTAAIRSLLGLGPSQMFLHTIFGGIPDLAAAETSDASEEARLRRMILRVRQLAPDETQALLEAYSHVEA